MNKLITRMTQYCSSDEFMELKLQIDSARIINNKYTKEFSECALSKQVDVSSIIHWFSGLLLPLLAFVKSSSTTFRLCLLAHYTLLVPFSHFEPEAEVRWDFTEQQMEDLRAADFRQQSSAILGRLLEMASLYQRPMIHCRKSFCKTSERFLESNFFMAQRVT